MILRGLGQGFASAGLPSVINIIAQILAFQWEGFYGLVLLTCASQACTGWQASLAAFGAVSNNANRLVHLTTVNEVAHHRANVCATIGTTTSHNGKAGSWGLGHLRGQWKASDELTSSERCMLC